MDTKKWRASIEKAIKRYSVEVKKIKQVPTDEEFIPKWKPIK